MNNRVPGPPAPRRRTPAVPFDASQAARYLKLLADTGLPAHAAEAVGSNIQCVKARLKADPVFVEEHEEALAIWRDNLEKEALRRATQGCKDPIFFKDTQVGHRVVYSDRLMELALKRHIPEYRDHLKVDATVRAGVLVVGATPATAAEWHAAASAAGLAGPPGGKIDQSPE